MANTRLEKSDYIKYIDPIEEKVMSGENYIQIALELNISRNIIPKIIELLNDSSSVAYDPERYKRIVQKYKNVLYRDLSYNKISDFQFLEIVKKLLAGEIDLKKAASERKTSVVQVLIELSAITNPDYYEEIQKFLKPYGFAKEDNQREIKNPFSAYPNNFQKEMFLLALTYRVSFKSMAKLLNTTVLDIAKGFRTVMNFNIDEFLFLETIGNDSSTEEIAYQKAKNYLAKRNTLVRYFNHYLHENQTEKKELIAEKLKELQHEIDDYKIKELLDKEKRYFTLEEKDTFARYFVKYYLGINYVSKVLRMDRRGIKSYMLDLAKRDALFSQYLDFYLKVVNNKTEIEIENGRKK